jgi:hypothetical protein
MQYVHSGPPQPWQPPEITKVSGGLFFYRERRSSGTHPAKALGPASERLGAVILAMIKTRCGFCESAIAKITMSTSMASGLALYSARGVGVCRCITR